MSMIAKACLWATSATVAASAAVAGAVGNAWVGTGAGSPSSAIPIHRPVVRAWEQAKEPASAVDLYGDPLPPGAIARLGTLRLQHGLGCDVLAYSPASDMLASGGRTDRIIRLWDADTGKEFRQILGPEKGVEQLLFSPDGSLLAGAGYDSTVYLWNTETGQEVRKLDGHRDHPILIAFSPKRLAFSPKGDLLAIGDLGGKFARLWEMKTGQLLRTFEIASDNKVPAVSLAFSPDGQSLAAVDGSKRLALFDMESGKLLLTLTGSPGDMGGVFFSSDGKNLITAGGKIGVWDIASRKELWNWVTSRGDVYSSTRCVDLSSDGKTAVAASSNGMIRFWDLTTGKEVHKGIAIPMTGSYAAISRDGRTLATTSANRWGRIYRWDVSSGQPKGDLTQHQSGITSATYGPDGRTIVTGSWGGTVQFWDPLAAKEIRRIDILKEERKKAEDAGKTGASSGGVPDVRLGEIAFSSDKKLMSIERSDHVILLLDSQTGKEVNRFKGGQLAFSPDNKLIAITDADPAGPDLPPNMIRLQDRETGKELRKLRVDRDILWFKAPTFSSNGITLIAVECSSTGTKDRQAKRFVSWDAATGKQQTAIAGGVGTSTQIALSPDGRTLAAAHWIYTGTESQATPITLWEMASGERRGELVGNQSSIKQIAFSPDGRTVASAGADHKVRLWDRFAAKEIGSLDGHRGWVFSVAFAPDGKTLVSGSSDSTAVIWDVSPFTERSSIAAELTAVELESCWKDLAGNAETGYRAMGRLLLSPKQSVPLLRERLPPAPTAQAQRLAQLIGELESDDFKTRDKAMKELATLGEVAAPALKQTQTWNVSLEVKQRIALLLAKLDPATPPPGTLRQVRAVEVLEYIGTAAAQTVLEKLGSGPSEARLTREAKSALGRLASQKGISP
jgi:WD40 repeat protein